MTAFAFETLLLLFLMFVLGIAGGLMLRRIRAKRLVLTRGSGDVFATDVAEAVRPSASGEIPRAPATRARATRDASLNEEKSPEHPSRPFADEGSDAHSQFGAVSRTGVSARPPTLASPEGGVADDLKRLKGIGPGNERKLHELGIFHFWQIAAWTPAQIAWVGHFLAFPGRVEREDWVGQAKALLEKESGTS